jgi:hypothetical protein
MTWDVIEHRKKTITRVSTLLVLTTTAFEIQLTSNNDHFNNAGSLKLWLKEL